MNPPGQGGDQPKPKRKHRATGRKAPGGRRPGAGRPNGTKNALPLGAVSAIRSLKLRVPQGAPHEVAELAGEALETVVDVMRGKAGRGAFFRLMAAKELRLETCGPHPTRLEHGGLGGGPIVVKVDREEP